jgi:hypothetical protein
MFYPALERVLQEMIEYRVPLDVVDAFVAEQLNLQTMEEVEERSQARENIIVALASYRSYVEEEKAKHQTQRASLMP